MANMIKKFMICVILTLSLTLSACGGVLPPGMYETYEPIDPNVTQKPTQTVKPTAKPQGEGENFGVVELSSDEDYLAVYYGVKLPEGGEYDANFKEGSRNYEFAPVVFGTTVDSSVADKCKISVSAVVDGYNPLGNPLSKGVVSNMTSKSRWSYFGTDDYIHGVSFTYPGTYYVTYKITVENFAEEIAENMDFDKAITEYKIERKFVIDKIDAYVRVESGFYFVKERGADIKKDAKLYITTDNGWDVSDLVYDDLKDTGKTEIYVPRKTIAIDEENIYVLSAVATKNGSKIDYSKILSKYFDLKFETGKWYIIPEEDEIEVAKIYDKIAGIGFEDWMFNYDYAKFDEYMEIVKEYDELSSIQKEMFHLYPDYLIKHDNSFKYDDYYKYRDIHDRFVKLVYDSGRVHLAKDLETLVEKHKAGECDIADIANYIGNLSCEGVLLENMIIDGELYASDLKFAVAKTFAGKLTNNGYVDLIVEEDAWTLEGGKGLVNKYINQNTLAFDLQTASAKLLANILKWNADGTMESALEYYEAYNAFIQDNADDNATRIFDILGKFVTFQIKDGETTAVLTDKFNEKDVFSEDMQWAISGLRDDIVASNESLMDFQKDDNTHASYVVAVSTCERYMLRLESLESKVEDFAFEDKNLAIALMNCSIENFEIAVEELIK